MSRLCISLKFPLTSGIPVQLGLAIWGECMANPIHREGEEVAYLLGRAGRVADALRRGFARWRARKAPKHLPANVAAMSLACGKSCFKLFVSPPGVQNDPLQPIGRVESLLGMAIPDFPHIQNHGTRIIQRKEKSIEEDSASRNLLWMDEILHHRRTPELFDSPVIARKKWILMETPSAAKGFRSFRMAGS